MAMENVTTWRPWALQPAREADWDALYQEQLPRIYNFFRYRVGHGPVAEDLTSLTFEKAWTARRRYRRDLAGFSTWLLAIARNVVVDHSRKQREHVLLDETAFAHGGERPDQAAERHEDEERLSKLLAELPDRERELVALKYGAGLTN